MGVPTPGCKCAVALIVVGAVFIAVGIIVGAVVKEVVLPKALNNIQKYKVDDDYLNFEHETCDDEYWNGYIFNMTNMEEAGNDDSIQPIMQQLGPYNYSRQACKFGNELVGDREFYYEYFTRWQFIPTKNGGRDNDTICTVNPALIGIVNRVYRPIGLDMGVGPEIPGGFPTYDHLALTLAFQKTMQSLFATIGDTDNYPTFRALSIPSMFQYVLAQVGNNPSLLAGAWMNAASGASQAFTLIGFGGAHSGFELGTNSSCLTAASCPIPANVMAVVGSTVPHILNSTNEDYGFLTLGGLTAWGEALAAYQGGNPVPLGTLCGTWSISTPACMIYAGWLGIWLAPNSVGETFQTKLYQATIDPEYTGYADLARLQWGYNKPFSPNLNAYMPTAPIFEWRGYSGVDMRLNESAYLLFDAERGLVTNRDLVPEFVILALNPTTHPALRAKWPVYTPPNPTQFALYILNHLLPTVAQPLLLDALLVDSGLLTCRTAREFLFEAVDGLVSAFNEPAEVGLYYDKNEATSRADALERGVQNRTVFLGGNADDVDEFVHKVEFWGSKVVPFYQEDLPVTGTNGNFKPGLSNSEPHVAFSKGLARPVHFDFVDETDEKGLTLQRFRAKESTFANATLNPANAIFVQKHTGFLDITGYRGAGHPIHKQLEVQISRPHHYGADPKIPRGLGVGGLDDNNKWYEAWELCVHKETGIAMRGHSTPQINLGFEFDFGYQTGRTVKANIIPAAWQDDFASIGSTEAAELSAALAAADGISLGFYVGFTIFGAILVGLGILVLLLWKRRGGDGKSTDVALN